MAAKGEVIINAQNCKGCRLCAHFCPRDCLSFSDENISAKGFVLPSFAEPEKCNACGICGRMCPDFAIEVYKSS